MLRVTVERGDGTKLVSFDLVPGFQYQQMTLPPGSEIIDGEMRHRLAGITVYPMWVTQLHSPDPSTADESHPDKWDGYDWDSYG